MSEVFLAGGPSSCCSSFRPVVNFWLLLCLGFCFFVFVGKKAMVIKFIPKYTVISIDAEKSLSKVGVGKAVSTWKSPLSFFDGNAPTVRLECLFYY